MKKNCYVIYIIHLWRNPSGQICTTVGSGVVSHFLDVMKHFEFFLFIGWRVTNLWVVAFCHFLLTWVIAIIMMLHYCAFVILLLYFMYCWLLAWH